MLPTPTGCWRQAATPRGWSQKQFRAPTAVRWRGRLAAAGRRSSPVLAHCILAPTGRWGFRLGRLTVRAGSAGAARGSTGGARAWSAPGTVATSFLPSGGVQLRSRCLLSVCYLLLQRDPSSSGSAGRLASLTSLPSERKISGKYRPAQTICRAGTGEAQGRLSVSVSDALRVPSLLKGPGCSHWSREWGDQSNPAMTPQIYQHLFYLQVEPRPGLPLRKKT